MRKFSLIALALAPFLASAITATKEYVDRKDGENAVAATNLVTSATNAVTVATAAAIATKADAVKRVTIDTGSGATNLVVRPVYANANLVIRECETANGQKQYRLIRKED
ncbi:MAG: hypothetical protein IJS36_08895 [Kiritimatiellae bacterium]|nr:hypothetical protein [Kiritimatiellia bacterium]